MPASSCPVDPRKPRPASAHAAKLAAFCDPDKYNDMRVGFRNVLTGYAGEQKEHAIPNATLWTCQLARRQVNTPQGLHDNARTKQEHNFSTEPTAGMKWSGGRNGAGWHVDPVRAALDPHHFRSLLPLNASANYSPSLLARCGPWSTPPSSRRSESVGQKRQRSGAKETEKCTLSAMPPARYTAQNQT